MISTRWRLVWFSVLITVNVENILSTSLLVKGKLNRNTGKAHLATALYLNLKEFVPCFPVVLQLVHVLAVEVNCLLYFVIQ